MKKCDIKRELATMLAVITGSALLMSAAASHAISVPPGFTSAGAGGFDDGWATRIVYDAGAARGTSNDRDNPLNALGSKDGKFFEIGTGSQALFSFGSLFDTSVSVFEITFGNPSNWAESVDVFVGSGGGASNYIGSISNAAASGSSGASLSIISQGLFDTVRLADTSDTAGGFDIDAVRVTAVPLPAAAWLLGSALFGFVALSNRRRLSGTMAS